MSLRPEYLLFVRIHSRSSERAEHLYGLVATPGSSHEWMGPDAMPTHGLVVSYHRFVAGVGQAPTLTSGVRPACVAQQLLTHTPETP